MKGIIKSNIYLKELLSYKKSIIFWSLGIILFLVIAMSKYQGFIASDQPVTDLFKDLPSGFGAVFGVGVIDLSSVSGYFAVCVLYLSIILGVHAVLLGSGILAKEERDKTAEFLYAKPITRLESLASKALLALTLIVILNIITIVSSLAIVRAFTQGPLIISDILFLMPAVFFVQLTFLIIGLAFAAIMKNPKRSRMLASIVLLLTYIFSTVVDISDKYYALRYFSPFKYFDAKEIFMDGSYNVGYILISLIFVVAVFIVSKIIYQKRDLNI